MKRNTKRTVLVGLAFLSISAFWQLYDSVIPLVLRYPFDIPDDIAGSIMALDNVLALFLLLIFMGAYRSLAVALMPDVPPPKPLRSKGKSRLEAFDEGDD